ncbi:lipoxygenase 6, chloroplastic-like isoform X2 [Amaranthus tricolor]|uniref:lipoxygenase 6, chloroplastic-like isoform X2 n=1 Tax=Amaranthus tricolor TaxID=29722 RepID=UPI0025843170|nr:lipoxygenase 6, chloroplastic-like isoform X2 [Amaranthus tricolor]
MLTSNLTPTIKSTLTDPSPNWKFHGARIPDPARYARTKKTQKGNGLKVRALISSGDRTVESGAPSAMEVKDGNGSNLLGSSGSDTQVKAIVSIKKKIRQRLFDKVEDQWFNFCNSVGQGIFIQLISEETDPDTNSGRSVEAYVTGWPPSSSSGESHIDEYIANFTVPSNFGNPGAILVTNNYNREFYLVEIVLHGFNHEPLYFPAYSWIHSIKDNSQNRIIFRNHTYLPSQTPSGIRDLRREDMIRRRGNGKGERKLHEMIYDYAPYNDLGNPDKENDLYRPALVGPERPYPRRCRTGRPPMKSDPESESRVEKPHPVYVPRDEAFEETKQSAFATGRLKAVLHNLVPQISAALSSSDTPFNCFSDIDSLYISGFMIKDDSVSEKINSITQMLSESTRLLKYDVPAVIKSDRFSWLRDNEFARQALAGVNPVNIELLKEFPITSKLDPAVYGPPKSGITKEVLEGELDGMSVEKAIEDKRLFIIDFHDLLLPFVNKINELRGRKAYASRTILFYTNSGTLKPVAIELSLPPSNSRPAFNRVYTHGHDATSYWVWKLAKAHVCAVDAGVHQLINHWLRTHASMEAYIIATNRQLSQMHPIYKLLHPHMRYTMEINALARQSLINGGGIIEATFTPGKYAMEISSAAYKSMWRFDMEALPADLLRRGMAEEDPTAPCGVKLVIEDYPYAADGLLIWSAISEWVESYVSHFYPDSNAIISDVELQEWWKEIKNEGHADKKDEPWWPKLESKDDLSRILTTMIWVASGQHAAINFGQYPFGGYVPNRPTLMRKLIPQENEPEYEMFLRNPQALFLSSLPSKLQATKVMAVQDTLSTHSPDEEYLGQEHGHWTDDQQVKIMFEKFSSLLKKIEETIHQRNKDSNMRNRTGAGVPPYELLLPTSGPGVTGRGIPNSISI